MKRIYTLLLSATVCAAASATTDLSSTGSIDRQRIAKAPLKAEQTDAWTSLGQGEWYEGFLNIFSDIADGLHWSVEIEESTSTPGVYRLKPYAVESSPIAQQLGGVDTSTEIIINATNAGRVYTVGDITPYGAVTFAGLNAENGFKAEGYGTLSDGIITFPANTFAYENPTDSKWYVYGNEGPKIILPGSEDKDYSLKLTTSGVCSDGELTTINLEAGEDIATVKAAFTRGRYDIADYAEFVAATGTTVAKEAFEINTPKVRGVYSIFAVGLNAAGKVVASAATYQVCNAETDADWVEVPNVETTFTDGFMSVQFSDIEAKEFPVVLEENTKTPGRFRFESPYGKLASEIFPPVDHSADHKHYIYVNATRPDSVYVELSVPGIQNDRWGSPYFYSYAAMFVDADESISNVPAKYFGFYANGLISAPALISWNNEPNNGFTAANFLLEIKPKEDGIEQINAAGESEAAFFNLSGRRIAAPTAPGLYIRNGRKILVR